MSITDKQLEANRLNAQKSTGPTTPEGKKRSSLNGQRHALTGATFLMTEEDRAAWEKFSSPFIDSLKPANPVERQFAQLIAQDNFRLNRIHAMEENTFALGHFGRAGEISAVHPEIHTALTQARTFANEGKVFQNLSLYEQRITRNMHKNMKALQELQDRRKAEERLAALEASKPKTRAAGVSDANTHIENTGQGFGFANAQTAALVPTPQTPITQTPPPLDEKKAA